MTSAPKILIVENDHDTRVTLRKTLEEEGYSIVSTTNGKSALEALRKSDSFRLILLDMNMPIMGGIEFLQTKAADPSIAAIPVVVITAESDTVSQSVADTLHKPIDLAELIQTIKRFLP